MDIHKVDFVKSSFKFSELPEADRPEYAFVGRSNVGKSSLINALCNQKIAKTSSSPGKTKLVNHFMVDGTWYLVDLPGYGYARVSKKDRAKFHNMIHEYCTQRSNLVSVFVLVDMRHPPQANDLEFMSFLGTSLIPFAIIFTKADKLSKNQLRKNLKQYHAKMLETWTAIPPFFVTSAEKKEGLDLLKAYMGDNMKYFYASVGEIEWSDIEAEENPELFPVEAEENPASVSNEEE
ncbi:UNVERIFIED_CONTAM: hypothetical protein GTU68_029164 [Idotea baltica]|nr:hypothetical protein [Idotea baltica]